MSKQIPTYPYQIRITAKEKETLDNLALALGYSYGGKASISQFLQAIANHEIIISQKRS